MDNTIQDQIKIPNECIKYILLQRTQYLILPKKKIFMKFFNKLTRRSWLKNIVILESFFRKGAIRKLYVEDMLEEYYDIKNFLPERCSRILDIGCGIGSINIFLYEHYNHDQDLEIHLLDKTALDQDVNYGFKNEAAFYNSLELAKHFLTLNSIPVNNVITHEVTPDYSIPINGTVDLIISLISWGFHYPVSVYLNQVSELLSENGRIIIDIRKDTGAEKELNSTFKHVEIISKTKKTRRVLVYNNE